MRVAKTIKELQEALGKSKVLIGFVPTMGYLHEGHRALVDAAKAKNQFIVISIFVNPLQFGPNEDLDRYPRDEEGDLAKAREWGVDVVFIPSVEEMYPQSEHMNIQVSSDLTDKLCGKARPGHFDGVATVVMKLSQIVQPDHIYFGMKDAQQVAVIKRMVSDFHLPMQVVTVDTVRESDGLAKSSRNVYLNEAERSQAIILQQALHDVGKLIERQPSNVTWGELVEMARRRIQTAPLAKIDYVDMLTWPDLAHLPQDQQVAQTSGEVILAMAVYFGKTRLIDNQIWKIGHGGE